MNKALENCRAVFEKWLFLEDSAALDILFATALSLWIPGDRVWLFLIAPPGGSKTELLRAISNLPEAFTLSELTPQTFISGMTKGAATDLLPKLDQKIVIVKDFTVILSQAPYDQNKIFGQLRDIYDGYYQKAFGSVGLKGYHSSFVLLAAVTPAIDRYRIVHQALGERFLKLRLRHKGLSIIERACEVMGKEDIMRNELSEATCTLFDQLRKEGRGRPRNLGASLKKRLIALAHLSATFRSTVERDHFHQVVQKPQPELGTRLVKQLGTLLISLARLRNGKLEDVYGMVARVARDTIPPERAIVIQALKAVNHSAPTGLISNETRIPRSTLTEILDDMWMLDIVIKEDERPTYWSLTPQIKELLVLSGLC